MADFNYQSLLKDMGYYNTEAGNQLNPLYDLAIKQLQESGKQQQYKSNDMAAARGFGQSGLAVDQQNKIASATQSSIAQQLAEKNARMSELARSMYESDRSYDLQNRSQLYGEYSDKRNYDYQKAQDELAQRNWQTQFDYTKGVDDRNYNYQVGRDKVSDSQWSQEFALKKKVGSGSGGNYSSPYASAPQSKTSDNPVNQVPEWFIKNYQNAKKSGTTIGLGTLPGTTGYARKMSNLIY